MIQCKIFKKRMVTFSGQDIKKNEMILNTRNYRKITIENNLYLLHYNQIYQYLIIIAIILFNEVN